MSRCMTPPHAASVPLHCPSPLPTFRNLGTDLAGVIFTCTEDSLDDCLRAGVFGLPRTHFQYVQHVRPSMVLFLFNFSTRELHGIFRAITGGRIDGEPTGVNPDWAAKFPAQVYVDTSDKYPPLPESAFRRLIAENYMSTNSAQFSFELDMEQVARLSEAFKQFAVQRSTPIPPSLQTQQNVLASFPAPSPTNMAPLPDRPSQAWLSEKTRRLSPVGRRPGLDFLNYGRPRSSMDYLAGHPPHFETDLTLLGGSTNLQAPRLSMDVNTFGNNQLTSLSNLLSTNTGAAGGGPSLMTGGTEALAAAQQSLSNSRLFQPDASSWKPDGVNLSGMMAQVNDASSSSLYAQAQLGVLSPETAALTHRVSVGRLSPGHLSPDMVDTWNVDTASANAFKIAATRLTPDIQLSQAAAGNISLEEAKRANIWSVNSKDMGLIDAQKLLSGISQFPEVQDAAAQNNLLAQHRADMSASLQEQSRLSQLGEGVEPAWTNPGPSSRKPPRPHSSTDGEVQSLTQNLSTMWSDTKAQLADISDAPDLYPVKSASRASLSKGFKSKESNIDESREMSEGSPSESGANSVQDQVNIGVLEADSNQYLPTQQNGDAFYPVETFAENPGMQMLTTPDYYTSSELGMTRNGKQLGMTNSLGTEGGLFLPNTANIGLEFGLDVTGQEATAAAMEEMSKLKMENDQLKLERSQLQKQLNNAMKKKTVDHQSSSNSTPKQGAIVDVCLVGGIMNAASMKVVNSDSLDEIKEISLPVRLSRGASVAVGEHLFYIGGVDADSANDTAPHAQTYHIDFRKGTEIVKTAASLNEPRSMLGAVSVGMKIFALGGSQGIGQTNTVEIYDPLRDCWKMGPSLNTSRHSFGATVVDNAIYVVGGYSEKGTIQSVERLDAREGRWIQLGSLSWSRAGLACCPIDHNLFAVGGHNGKSVLATAEILDLRKGIVMECLAMMEPRQYGTATLMGDSIYIVGGVQEMDTDINPKFSHPEVYNTLLNTSSVVSTTDQLSMGEWRLSEVDAPQSPVIFEGIHDP